MKRSIAGTLRRACGAVAVALLAGGSPSAADVCAADSVPAATLLLPFFAVDLSRADGRTTLISINNAAPAATLAHVTLWTDWGVPTLVFDVYLTGYDVQTLNLRDFFQSGYLPRTAPPAQDPKDIYSPKGQLSADTQFPGCEALPYASPALSTARQENLRLAHTGENAPLYGGCLAAAYGDGLARGYVTVDVVTRCSDATPASPGYFDSIAGNDNVLWGRSIDVNPAENYAHAERLVHIEACPRTGGTGRCPFAPGAYTFYGRFRAVSGDDRREPLPTTFVSSFANGGAFSGGTKLVVWRDPKVPAGADTRARSCATLPSWFLLPTRDVVAFDEQEGVVDLCTYSDNTIPIGSPPSCAPLAAQEIDLGGGNAIADDPAIPFPFGWIYLNLNHSIREDPFPGVAQAWVQTVSSASGRYSVGYNAVATDSGCDARSGGVVLIP